MKEKTQENPWWIIHLKSTGQIAGPKEAKLPDSGCTLWPSITWALLRTSEVWLKHQSREYELPNMATRNLDTVRHRNFTVPILWVQTGTPFTSTNVRPPRRDYHRVSHGLLEIARGYWGHSCIAIGILPTLPICTSIPIYLLRFARYRATWSPSLRRSWWKRSTGFGPKPWRTKFRPSTKDGPGTERPNKHGPCCRFARCGGTLGGTCLACWMCFTNSEVKYQGEWCFDVSMVRWAMFFLWGIAEFLGWVRSLSEHSWDLWSSYVIGCPGTIFHLVLQVHGLYMFQHSYSANKAVKCGSNYFRSWDGMFNLAWCAETRSQAAEWISGTGQMLPGNKPTRDFHELPLFLRLAFYVLTIPFVLHCRQNMWESHVLLVPPSNTCWSKNDHTFMFGQWFQDSRYINVHHESWLP